MERRIFIPLPQKRSASEWSHRNEPVLDHLARHAAKRRRRRVVTVSAAAVACALGISWRSATPERTLPVPSAIVSMPTRERLPDRTVVELSGAARIRADFGASLRRVELLAGEAHFTVAPDSVRSFVVVAGNVELRAAGAEFSVQLGRTVELIVTGGRVVLERAGTAEIDAPPPDRLAIVEAGQRTVVDPAVMETPGAVPMVMNIPPEELADRLAWRAPRIEFTHTKLGDAVRLFNEHSRARVVLGESALGELRLNGIVRTDNTASLLQLLAAEFGLEAQHGSAGELIIVRRK